MSRPGGGGGRADIAMVSVLKEVLGGTRSLAWSLVEAGDEGTDNPSSKLITVSNNHIGVSAGNSPFAPLGL